MLALVFAVTASTMLPSEKDLGVALAVSRACVDANGYTNCGPQPRGARFRQFLCVEYGSNKEKLPVVRCVYKGARMLMPRMPGAKSIFFIGNGAIDVIYDGEMWLPETQ